MQEEARCLARASKACDVDEVIWPVSDQQRDAGAEYILFVAVCCIVLYSTVH